MVSMALGLVSEILILAGLLGVLLTVIILLELAEAKATVAKTDESWKDSPRRTAKNQPHSPD